MQHLVPIMTYTSKMDENGFSGKGQELTVHKAQPLCYNGLFLKISGVGIFEPTTELHKRQKATYSSRQFDHQLHNIGSKLRILTIQQIEQPFNLTNFFKLRSLHDLSVPFDSSQRVGSFVCEAPGCSCCAKKKNILLSAASRLPFP